MYSFLKEQNTKPPLFSAYTAEELWTDPHLARQMLTYHLDPEAELASRPRSFIERSVRWLAETFRLSEETRVLDLGCGPGLYANALAKLGARVTGVDFSSHALAHARAAAQGSGVQVEYREADYLRAELGGPYDLVLLIFGDFCPLSPAQRKALLTSVSEALGPGGRFVLDVTSLAHFQGIREESGYEWAPEGGFWAATPYFLFTNRFTYPEANAYLDRFAILEDHRRREIFNWIQCYSPETLGIEFKEAGWMVEECIGNLAGDRYDPEETFFGAVTRPS